MQRPSTTAAAASGSEWPDEKWKKETPILTEFLSAALYDDGTVRELSQLTVKLQDGQVLACLQDKDLRRGLYRVSSTVAGALKAIEKALAESSADWRPWKDDRGGKRK